MYKIFLTHYRLSTQKPTSLPYPLTSPKSIQKSTYHLLHLTPHLHLIYIFTSKTHMLTVTSTSSYKTRMLTVTLTKFVIKSLIKS